MTRTGRWRQKDGRVALIFLLPSLIGFGGFILGPIAASFGLSLTSWDLITPPRFVALDNYLELVRNPLFWESFRHTLAFIVGYLPAVMALGLAIALGLNAKFPGRTFFRGLYFLPVVSSWVAVSMLWEWLLNPIYGLVNYTLSLVGIAGPAWLQDPAWAMQAIIITSVSKDLGFVAVLFLGGLQNIPETYHEAATIDGAGAWRRFWSITLPLLAPTTFFILIISLINSFQVFDQVWVMTEGGPAGATSVVVEQIYRNAFRYYRMGYASALSWILFAVVFVVTAIQMKLQKRLVGYEQ